MVRPLMKQLESLTLIACVLICAFPAAGASAAPVGMDALKSGKLGPALSQEKLSELRGMYIPAVNIIVVQIGDTNYFKFNADNPGAVSLMASGPGGDVKATAAAGLPGISVDLNNLTHVLPGLPSYSFEHSFTKSFSIQH